MLSLTVIFYTLLIQLLFTNWNGIINIFVADKVDERFVFLFSPHLSLRYLLLMRLESRADQASLILKNNSWTWKCNPADIYEVQIIANLFQISLVLKIIMEELVIGNEIDYLNSNTGQECMHFI